MNSACLALRSQAWFPRCVSLTSGFISSLFLYEACDDLIQNFTTCGQGYLFSKDGRHGELDHGTARQRCGETKTLLRFYPESIDILIYRSNCNFWCYWKEQMRGSRNDDSFNWAGLFSCTTAEDICSERSGSQEWQKLCFAKKCVEKTPMQQVHKNYSFKRFIWQQYPYLC